MKILNKNEVVEALKAKTGVDGINLETLTAQTYQNTNDANITVNITAMGYKDDKSGGTTNVSTIVIKSNETYSITATAVAVSKIDGVKIKVGSIVITSTRILYNR